MPRMSNMMMMTMDDDATNDGRWRWEDTRDDNDHNGDDEATDDGENDDKSELWLEMIWQIIAKMTNIIQMYIIQMSALSVATRSCTSYMLSCSVALDYQHDYHMITLMHTIQDFKSKQIKCLQDHVLKEPPELKLSYWEELMIL